MANLNIKLNNTPYMECWAHFNMLVNTSWPDLDDVWATHTGYYSSLHKNQNLEWGTCIDNKEEKVVYKICRIPQANFSKLK